MILDIKTNMSSTRSSSSEGTEERGDDDDDELHCDNNEKETSTISSSSGLIGYKRNQVFDCSLIQLIGDHDDDDDDDDEFDSESSSDEEDLFEINLNLINNKKEGLPLDTIIEEDCYDESTVFSLDIHNSKDIMVDHDGDGAAAVYVAVGHQHGDSSMGALSWALKHAVTPSTTVYLLHVFPEIKLIPSPLGKIPRSRVNVEYVNHYLNQKKGKSKLLLQKFIDLCLHSKVKVEMILIEGDNIAEAILELIGKRDIRKLVIGTTTSNLRECAGGSSRRQNGIANKVFKNAQESCEVKIICEGRAVLKEMIGYSSSSSRSKESSSSSSSQDEVEPRARAVAPLMRFMTIPLWLFRPRFSSPR